LPEPVRHPSFHGDGGTLFGIHLKNILLTIVTLGIYSFWAKVNIRQYLYAQTSMGGDRFAYHGTGGELLRGSAKAFGLVFLGLVVAGFLSVFVHEIAGPVVTYAGMLFLFFPLALLGSRRYRMSRTSWRGIRFSFRGEYDEFLAIFVPGVLLSVLTLGLYYPWFHASVRRFVVDGTRFGHTSFAFTGNGRELFARHLLLYLLFPLTLGIYWFWHAAQRHRYYWEHTRFGTARFRSTMTGDDLLVFTLMNGLLMLVTIGIAFPWVQARTQRFHSDRIGVAGIEAFDLALQEARASDPTGEGLSEMFDVDLVGADYFGL
jgi:uncharacterized membrane protein YjgN (DUF898 family)